MQKTSPDGPTQIVALQETQQLPTHHTRPAEFDLTDDMALAHWLDIYQSRSLSTWRSYRKEAERFRFFLAHQKGATPQSHPHLMRDATERDVMMFEAALMGTAREGIRPGLQAIDENGRPSGPFFKAPLKSSSANQALFVLHSMYEHWSKANEVTKKPYTAVNPLARVIRSSSRARDQSERSLPKEAITAMTDLLELQEQEAKTGPRPNAIAAAKAIRTRWMLHLLFGLWLRRAEAASLRMNSFYKTYSGWFLKIMRKGGKKQEVPVPGWIMDMLFSYRASLGMPAAPSLDDSTPAILTIQPKGQRTTDQAISTQTIYLEIKRLAKETAAAIADGHLLTDMEPEKRNLIAQQLSLFSPHWFRHTGASIAINEKKIDLPHASKMLGHSSTDITSAMYYHEDREILRDGLSQMGSALHKKT